VRRGLLLVVCFAGCDPPVRDLPFGAECRGDAECESRLCVSESRSTTKGFCTESCGSSEECPDSYSCSGVTRRRIAVCTKSTGVPFLDAQQGAKSGPSRR